jgi:HD-GYP domain-containing protein (c-di-GMP phosphodiesterase class II)
MNLSKDEIERVSISGLMHDIGKVGIDEKLLNSDKKLSTKNLQIMRKHSEIGFRILSSVNEFSEIGSIILSHHERWNGTGYPRQIKGEEIPLLSRILSIADSFDAMTTERTYKDVLSFDEAIFEMQSCSGTQFDPIIVQKFIELIKSSKIPSITRNSN